MKIVFLATFPSTETMKYICGVIVASIYAGCNPTSTTVTPSLSPEVGFRNVSRFGKSFSGQRRFGTPQEYIQLFNELLGNKTYAYMLLSDRRFNSTPSCPPEYIQIGSESFAMDQDPSEIGSGTSIFETIDKSIVVKRVDTELDFLLTLLWRDEAALNVLEDALNVSPIPLELVQEPSMCMLRTMGMTSVGENTLFDYYEQNGLLDADTAVAIGKRAIRLIEQVHSRGLIHGDIHWGNFVYSNESDIVGSLRLIDYGRSMPYIDPVTGDHLGPDMLMPTMCDQFVWNDAYLSINELQGNPISRRDDMYRLAEMLSFLMEGTDAIMEKRPPPRFSLNRKPRDLERNYLVPRRDVLNKKRFRSLKQTTHKCIAELYYGSQMMELEETPNYNILDMYS